jgi:hypothetical protein
MCSGCKQAQRHRKWGGSATEACGGGRGSLLAPAAPRRLRRAIKPARRRMRFAHCTHPGSVVTVAPGQIEPCDSLRRHGRFHAGSNRTEFEAARQNCGSPTTESRPWSAWRKRCDAFNRRNADAPRRVRGERMNAPSPQKAAALIDAISNPFLQQYRPQALVVGSCTLSPNRGTLRQLDKGATLGRAESPSIATCGQRAVGEQKPIFRRRLSAY